MSRDYVLVTDDSCDLPVSYCREHDIHFVELKYIIEGKLFKSSDRPIKMLYDDLRAGKQAQTTQVNQQEFVSFFTPFLEAGKDILYIAFSSGLSGTYQSGVGAAKILSEQYPDRKIYVIDSLCASLGQGLLIHLAIVKRGEGYEIDQLKEYILQMIPKILHIVTVDDLMYLHKGGRISKTSAIAGSLLGIKPIIYLNDEGKLVSVDKVRGRQQALVRLVDDLEAHGAGENENNILFVCHGDCLEDAEKAAEIAKKRFKIKECIINYVGSVIGSHTGPGVVALFLVGNER